MPRIKIDFGGPWVDEFDPVEETKIAPDKILANIEEHASKMAWYASLHAAGSAKLREVKDLVKRIEGDLYKEIVAKNDKKPTEAAITAEIQSHADYQEAQGEFRAIEGSVELLAATLEAFRHRRDMIVQMASHLRAAEMIPSEKRTKY